MTHLFSACRSLIAPATTGLPAPLRRRLALGGLLLLLGIGARPALAQQTPPFPDLDPLLKELDRQGAPSTSQTQYTEATFKSVRIVNGHSVETTGKGTLQFLIGHRFGRLNEGSYNFFGLDEATIRLGLEYGITPRLTVGVGRSSLGKTLDGFVKYKAIRQGTGPGTLPFTLTLLGSSALSTIKYPNGPVADRPLRTRLTYSYQALLARKFSPDFSVQLMPTLVHRNLVDTREEDNNVFAMGSAVRYKLTKRLALMGEYYYVISKYTADQGRNSLALGFDIETGGHVFQLHLTNSQGMIEKFFVPQTSGNFFKGDIYFGFNISRVFTLGKH